MRNKSFLPGIVGMAATLLCNLALAQDAFIAEVKRFSSLASRLNSTWDGPSTGTSAQRNKSIIYVSADQDNGGACGGGQGAAEAAKVVDGSFRLIDGQSTASGRTAVLRKRRTA